MLNESPNGIFTFSNYNAQAGVFNGQSSYVSISPTALAQGNQVTMAVWADQLGPGNGDPRGILMAQSATYLDSCTSTGPGFGVYTGYYPHGNSALATGGSCPAIGAWTQYVGTYDGSTARLYVNGVLVANAPISGSLAPGVVVIGEASVSPYFNFNGMIANAQVYDSVLSPTQIQQLYQEGVSGLPVFNLNFAGGWSSLSGWWSLNGNANDLSGYADNGVTYNVIYALPTNYARDSALSYVTPAPPQPVPGILSCTSNSRCSNSGLPDIYLSSMPLEVQSGYAQTGNFNGQSSYISTGTTGQPLGSSPRSVFAWVNAPTAITSGLYTIYWYGGVSGQTGTGLLIYNGNLYVSTPGVGYSSTLAITPNVWHFVGYTYASGATQATVYVDGQSQSTTGGGIAFATTSGASDIGLASSLGYYYPAGSISDVQVYNTALSANQVQLLYQGGITGLPLNGAGPVGWWPLNGNANDYSGQGNNGTATSVTYPYFSGTYNSPGMSTITSTANEWQALGLANT